MLLYFKCTGFLLDLRIKLLLVNKCASFFCSLFFEYQKKLRSVRPELNFCGPRFLIQKECTILFGAEKLNVWPVSHIKLKRCDHQAMRRDFFCPCKATGKRVQENCDL